MTFQRPRVKGCARFRMRPTYTTGEFMNVHHQSRRLAALVALAASLLPSRERHGTTRRIRTRPTPACKPRCPSPLAGSFNQRQPCFYISTHVSDPDVATHSRRTMGHHWPSRRRRRRAWSLGSGGRGDVRRAHLTDTCESVASPSSISRIHCDPL